MSEKPGSEDLVWLQCVLSALVYYGGRWTVDHLMFYFLLTTFFILAQKRQEILHWDLLFCCLLDYL